MVATLSVVIMSTVVFDKLEMEQALLSFNHQI